MPYRIKFFDSKEEAFRQTHMTFHPPVDSCEFVKFPNGKWAIRNTATDQYVTEYVTVTTRHQGR